jgi:hypothetical protein
MQSMQNNVFVGGEFPSSAACAKAGTKGMSRRQPRRMMGIATFFIAILRDC